MFHLFIRCFTKKYFQFKGRASRKEYLSFLIFNHLVVLLLKILIKITALKITAIFLGAYLLASLSPFILVAVRRMHDINLSGWWGLLLTIIIIVLRLIPDKNNIVSILSIIVLIIVIFIICKKGTSGSNRYGKPPMD
ncbi:MULTISPECIES: DUF805 domain-containing protein [unclassified Rickettsia]|uniref:DUF805 domain-containing protein n=1 Tax=unclassified Rickettsia TaxID=114295 RepID=UPI0031331AD0